MQGIIIIVVVAVILLLVATPLGRALLSMLKSMFIADVMSNPKAAEAAFRAAIEEARKEYSNAADVVAELSGLAAEEKAGYDKAIKEIEQLEANLERLASAETPNMEDINLLAQRRALAIQRRDTHLSRLNELRPTVEEAKELMQLSEKRIQELKHQKDLKITEMRMNSQMADMYKKLDKARASKGTDKLLEAVEDNVKTSKRQAAGLKEKHDTSLDTREKRLDDKLANMTNDSYVAELLAKHKKAN